MPIAIKLLSMGLHKKSLATIDNIIGVIMPVHAHNNVEHLAIERVLETYYTAVTNRDETLFLTTLVNKDIPFFSVGNSDSVEPELTTDKMHNYKGFSQGIFHSEERYRQTFERIQIAQEGALATASLYFTTYRLTTGGTSRGWKTLQLVKIGAEWKIVSEIYTAHRSPQ
jgi:ketosteroid isomerase-like protein